MSLLHVLRLSRALTILLYGIAIAASFTAVGQVVFRSVLWHRPLVLLLTLVASLTAWVAWTRFRTDGTSQSFLLLAAFAALAVLYAPHALLEGETFDPAHLLFGPLSRLTFSIGLIAAIANVSIPGIHRLPPWLWVALILLASGLTDLAAHSEAAAQLWRANPVGFLRRVEGLALACQLLGMGWLAGRWWWQRRPFVLALAGGVLALATGSALFLTTAPWQGRWWVAHLGLFVCAVIMSVGIIEERIRRGMLGSTLDFDGTAVLVTARQAAEQRLIDLTAELEAANRELEAFSYAVSHDLRAPLRSINGFSQALLEDAAARLDEQDKDYLTRIRAATQRMAQLIEALLALSRITRAELQRQDLDLSAMTKAIAADLQRQEPRRQVTFIIAEGLRASGDPRLLRVALENLLGNAWKFTAKRPHACIEVGRLKQPDGTPAFFVRDNGAGFEMAYADKLFAPFQRLHRTAEYEGTGIGLATLQRIIYRHGGRTWAEGAVDQGATFYFTLSKSASDT